MLMPIMDSGSRPKNPAVEKVLVPGAEKIARYGLANGDSCRSEAGADQGAGGADGVGGTKGAAASFPRRRTRRR
ncbi:hypothetical protein GCM10009863_45650 [Streptomyces axinellae]|uniref:Uncharacterized protein n=1 Tax=Streptomyces axinellae TaxID=552788 RepID=A0ABP6CT24_9ACTN